MQAGPCAGVSKPCRLFCVQPFASQAAAGLSSTSQPWQSLCTQSPDAQGRQTCTASVASCGAGQYEVQGPLQGAALLEHLPGHSMMMQ